MTPPPFDPAALRAKALAATPGPWQVIEEANPYIVDGKPLEGPPHTERRIFTAWDHPQLKGPHPVVNRCAGLMERSPAISIDAANAAYIASIDPTTLLALLSSHDAQAARVKALEAAIKETIEIIDGALTNATVSRITLARRWLSAALAPAPPAPVCAICGKPATCLGAYDGATVEAYACDSCCAHGNEDGRCRPVAPPAPGRSTARWVRSVAATAWITPSSCRNRTARRQRNYWTPPKPNSPASAPPSPPTSSSRHRTAPSPASVARRQRGTGRRSSIARGVCCTRVRFTRQRHPSMRESAFTGRRPRVLEKVVQQHIVQALGAVGAKVYVLGRPGRRDRKCPKCGEAMASEQGTRQTPGIPDLLAFLPTSGYAAAASGERVQPHQLWIECKAEGGKRSDDQTTFAVHCEVAEQAYLVGGLDVVLAYLQSHGYIKEYPGMYRRPA